MAKPDMIGHIGPRTDAETMTTWAWVHYLQAPTPAERIAWGRAYEALAELREVTRTVLRSETDSWQLGESYRGEA